MHTSDIVAYVSATSALIAIGFSIYDRIRRYPRIEVSQTTPSFYFLSKNASSPVGLRFYLYASVMIVNPSAASITLKNVRIAGTDCASASLKNALLTKLTIPYVDRITEFDISQKMLVTPLVIPPEGCAYGTLVFTRCPEYEGLDCAIPLVFETVRKNYKFVLHAREISSIPMSDF